MLIDSNTKVIGHKSSSKPTLKKKTNSNPMVFFTVEEVFSNFINFTLPITFVFKGIETLI